MNVSFMWRWHRIAMQNEHFYKCCFVNLVSIWKIFCSGPKLDTTRMFNKSRLCIWVAAYKNAMLCEDVINEHRLCLLTNIMLDEKCHYKRMHTKWLYLYKGPIQAKLISSVYRWRYWLAFVKARGIKIERCRGRQWGLQFVSIILFIELDGSHMGILSL